MRSFIAWIFVAGFPLAMWAVFAMMIRRAKRDSGSPLGRNASETEA